MTARDAATKSPASEPPLQAARKPWSQVRAPIRVALVDDHHLVREGLRHVLELQPGILVVGEADDRPAAFDLLASGAPDIVLLDITYPDDDGLVMLRELSARRPGVRIIVLTMHRDAETVRQALRAGPRATW